jgi:hypothetical protein
MCGLMSLTFSKRVCVVARSGDGTGHVAVLTIQELVASRRSVFDSSTPFRLSDFLRASAPLGSEGPVATGDRGGGDHRLRSGVLEGIAGRP